MSVVIRAFDIILSIIALLFFCPLMLFLGIWIKIGDGSAPVLYRQTRVGKGGRDFCLFKFRTMNAGSDKSGLITIGDHDPRISHSGYYIRKYKLDELPQLLNVLRGEMSLVGPRPEVRKYVDLYTPSQTRILDVRPGITDYASIEYMNENEILATSSDPDRMYVDVILPAKIALSMKYVENYTLGEYFRILFITAAKLSGVIAKHIVQSFKGRWKRK